MALFAEYGFNNVATDSSGNARHLTAGTYTTGRTGQAAGSAFTGLVLGAALNNWTVLGWIRIDSAPGDWAAIFTEGSNLYWELSSGRQLSLYISGTLVDSGATLVATATDVHIAIRGGNSASPPQILVNGTVVGTGSSSHALPAGTYSAGGGGGDTPFNLHLDDFRIYDTQLSNAEIIAASTTPVGGASASAVTLTPATLTLSARPTTPQSAVVLSRPTVTLSATPVSPAGVGAVSLTPAAVSLSARALTPQSAVVLSRPTVTLSAVSVSAAAPTVHAYVTGIQGRYFVDQDDQPILLRGDSPWSALIDLSTAQWAAWCENREGHGFNLALVSLVGAVDNGGPSNDGATFDGILPFVAGDITAPNETYWARVDTMISEAESHGITLMLYPMDGWNAGEVFSGKSQADCADYGTFLGERYGDRPNILWAVGGDYMPITNEYEDGSPVDLQFWACLNAIRLAGATQPRTIQLIYNRSWSTGNPFWAPKVDFNFVYTYMPTYEAVLKAYAESTKPALFSEGNYAYLNLQGDAFATTDETIRRQICWALTSGSPGDFMGTSDWLFQSGWETRLDTDAVVQANLIRDWFEALPNWQDLVPDADLVTAGRGTPWVWSGNDGPQWDGGTYTDVSQSDYVTVARTADKSLAVIYLPDASAGITIDTGEIGASPSATWVDPSSGDTVSATWGSSFTRATTNDDGGSDWLLLLEATPVVASAVTLTPATVSVTARPVAPVARSAVTLAPAVVSLSTGSVAPVGVAIVTLAPAVVNLSAVTLTPTPGAVGVTLTAVTVSINVPAVAPEPQAPGVTLSAVTVTLTPVALSGQPGQVSVSLAAAVVHISARSVSAGGPVGLIPRRAIVATLREDNYRARMRP